MNIPENVFGLSTCKSDEIPRNTRIFYKHEVTNFLDLYLPYLRQRGKSLLEISQICPEKYELDIPIFVKISDNTTWIQINKDALDLSCGLHIYQVKLIDQDTKSVEIYYFAYRILNDSRNKDYVYMNR